jgi:hypothetical protein
MKGIEAGYEPSTPLQEDEDGHDFCELKLQNLNSWQTCHLRRLLIVDTIVFFVSVLLLFTIYIRSTPSTPKFIKKLSSYSPAREAFNVCIRYFQSLVIHGPTLAQSKFVEISML